MPPPASRPSRFDSLRTAQTARVRQEFVRRRPWAVAPFGLFVTAVYWLGGYQGARVAGVLAIFVINMSWVLGTAYGARTTTPSDRSLVLSQWVILGTQLVMVGITGGLTSPLTPLLLTSAIASVVSFGRRRQTYAMLGLTLLGIVAFSLLPRPWFGPPVPPWVHAAVSGAALLFSVFLLSSVTLELTDAYRVAGDRIDALGEEVLTDARQRVQRLQSIGAKVAHELKNPLAAIKGLGQLLERNVTDDRSRERLRVISSEVLRMEAILRDYLSFSRPLEDLSPEQVDVARLLADVRGILEARCELAGVAMTLTGTAPPLMGDARRLKEALLNLAANALEATPAGGTVALELHEGEQCRLVIRDTGRGLAPDQLARVGTAFYTTRDEGTGLGVVLARAVVEQHGGTLTYESQVGQGTTVTLLLPWQGPPAAETPDSPPSVGTPG